MNMIKNTNLRSSHTHYRRPINSIVGGGMICLVWCCLLSIYTAMAVDRSKFRTCEQTSFCRRHRNDIHRHLFKYQLQKETIQFHSPIIHQPVDTDSTTTADGIVVEGGGVGSDATGGGVWKSLSRSLLGGLAGGSSSDKKKGLLDPYVTGPSPTVTGLLQNTGAITTTKEHLNFTITCLSNGLVRLRVTELYGTVGAAYEQARITFDELVLHQGKQQQQHGGPAPMTPAAHALYISDIRKYEYFQKLEPVVIQQPDQYVLVQYGDKKDENNMILLIQLAPFVVSLYRESTIAMGPIVTMGAEQMMHFEVRRYKDQDQQTPKVDEGEEDEDGDNTEAEPTEEKEIVGYWEDGLAIYADGTREEKKVLPEEGADTHRHLSAIDEHDGKVKELDPNGLWEESFGSHKDTKPFGPMSVGMDITFPNSQHLFGLPEHASSTILKTTKRTPSDTTDDEDTKPHYKEPYRLYNLDVFEYELDETMALYGHVPLIVSQSVTTGSVGVFWFNPTETFVDVMQNNQVNMTTHWISESGIIDLFLLPGPNPPKLYEQYATLTGTTPVPPIFALGYHQCRWNYKDENDVYMVHGKFEELDYPYDVLWLDIEHTDGKRYFTWDKPLFPNPTEMLNKLAATGRRMVTIIDPHMKRDDNYYIHKEATAKGLYIKDKDGKNDYDGWCWPGSSSYLDFTAAHVRAWWAEQFGYNKYIGSTPSLFTWNDMNEPSVFNGPEVSMQKDLKNLNQIEHREWHNLYGMLFHRATTEGHVQRNGPDHNVRPFVLSRSFFAGSQKYGAIWTGDNKAEWGHLEVAAPMLLSLNVAALSFVGADVGGFFGNPDAELFTRWMQAGAYQPFFRGHAHHDSKRREPWLFDTDTLYRLRQAAMLRYALLPYWYTTFYVAEITGMPVMRTMWMQYPKTEALFATDDQYLIGADLLVKPITGPGITSTEVRFPTDDIWYDANSLSLVSGKTREGPGNVVTLTVPADINTIPAYQRGGSVLFRKLRLRRSTVQMKTDPYTLYIALNLNSFANGTLYMDDEETFHYQQEKGSEYVLATVTAQSIAKTQIRIKNTVDVGTGWMDFIPSLAPDRLVERIVIMLGTNNNAHQKPPKTITTLMGTSSNSEKNTLSFVHSIDKTNGVNSITIRKPDVSMVTDWEISITF